MMLTTVGAIAVAFQPAWAQQQGGLLDPSKMGRGNATADLPVVTVTGLDTSEARSMAGSATSGVTSLISRLTTIGPELEKQEADAAALRRKLAAAVADREAQLAEYRNGMFCSGCNQTRSQILAKGEQFPHSGQTIIQPTPQQIAAKEAELDAAISRIRRELADADKKVKDLEDKLDEAVDQISKGAMLLTVALLRWHNQAIEFENRTGEQYEDARTAALRQVGGIVDFGLASTKSHEVPAAIGDLDTLARQIDRLDAEQAARWNRVQTEITAVVRDAAAHRKSIEVALSAATPRLSYKLLLSRVRGAANATGGYAGAGILAAGDQAAIYFRLGDATPSRRGEVLPRVSAFVQNWLSTGRYGRLMLDSAPIVGTRPLAPDRIRLLEHQATLAAGEEEARLAGVDERRAADEAEPSRAGAIEEEPENR